MDTRRDYQKKYRQDYKSRTKRVNLTFSNDEFRAFSKAAQSKKVATYVKELALAGLEQQAHIPDNLHEELKTLRFAIRNIANNVNQIAHHSNTIRSMTEADTNNLLQHIKQLEDVVFAYTQGKIIDGNNDY